jgi:hypothetical protein
LAARTQKVWLLKTQDLSLLKRKVVVWLAKTQSSLAAKTQEFGC